MTRKFILAVALCLVAALCIGPSHAWLVTPPASSGGCSSNGPLDVLTGGETGILSFGVRAEKKSYNSNLISISVNGTSGTYALVGLNGCDLNLSAMPDGTHTILATCTSTSAPTTTTGCPIKILVDQTGNGCNPTAASTTVQAWLVVNQLNGHPTIFWPTAGGAYYTCTLPGAVGAMSFVSEAYFDNTCGCAYGAVSFGDGTNFGSDFIYSNANVSPESRSNDGTTVSQGVGGSANAYFTYIGTTPNSAGAYLTTNGNSSTLGSSVTTIITGTKVYVGAIQGGANTANDLRLGEYTAVTTISGCVGGGGFTGGDCTALGSNVAGYW